MSVEEFTSCRLHPCKLHVVVAVTWSKAKHCSRTFVLRERELQLSMQLMKDISTRLCVPATRFTATNRLSIRHQ